MGEVLDAIRAVARSADVRELPSDERAHVAEVLTGSGTDYRRDFYKLAVARGWNLLELKRDALQLEEVFRQLTTGAEAAEKASKDSEKSSKSGTQE